MNRNRVPIVNNATTKVTFDIRTGNTSRGTITLRPSDIHYVRGVNLTYETLWLKDSRGNFTDQSINMDELADDGLEKVEVTHDFQLVRHRRRTLMQKIADLNPFKPRPRDDTLPTHNNDGHG